MNETPELDFELPARLVTLSFISFFYLSLSSVQILLTDKSETLKLGKLEHILPRGVRESRYPSGSGLTYILYLSRGVYLKIHVGPYLYSLPGPGK